ncbi:putative sporulation protein, polysaccharide deacetylase family [Caldibacillus debilis GB1]|jgi:probable sporulation protein (polysaccharide deacetylase family)|uniref:Putative sporulation protein, polysaccharide deacetylase family n=2 Tax=Caldibacillus debilis TaxID=301148 RepID=A0A420VBK2_9BACI|nr:putative sporulation protein, polysaccharide deacetylase family [Caldibacillus debilis GB1]
MDEGKRGAARIFRAGNMRKPFLQKLWALSMIVLFSYLLVHNPFSEIYVNTLKTEALPASGGKDPLYGEILHKAKNYEKPAQNAKIDKVWKKMPGYNGLKVDVEASYRKMKPYKKFLEDKLVFRQIPPQVHLEQLPPSPIYRGHPDKPMVAFTFNVAWGEEYLSTILEILKKHHISATFFLEGRWAKGHAEAVKMIHEGGHEIGSHSYSHPDMAKISEDEAAAELKKTNDILRATVGIAPKWFAPPSGSFNDRTVALAAKMNMETILWSVDTIDWQKPSPNTIVDRVRKQAHNGAIILMHPTASTAEALEPMISVLKEEGYKIGSVSELLDEKRIITRTLSH